MTAIAAAPPVSAALTQGGARSPWMVSAPVDLVLFVGVTLSTLVAWLVSDVVGVNGQYVLVGAAVANGPHLISTWTRVYMPRKERFSRWFHYWLVPAALAAYAIGCRTLGGDVGQRLVTSTIFYWASWHFVAQSWGVLRLYQRRHGAAMRPEARLEKALIFLPAFFFVLHRLYTGPRMLFDTPVYFIRPPALVVNGLGAVIAVVAVAYLVLLGRAARQGWRTPLVRPVYLGFNALGFAMPFLVIKDGTSAFAAAAFWHAVQYLAIVWTFNRRLYAGGVDKEGAHFVSWISQPGRSLAYVGMLAGCAAAVYLVTGIAWAIFGGVGFMDWGLTMWTALTLGHYYLDGVIWKTRRYDLKPLAT